LKVNPAYVLRNVLGKHILMPVYETRLGNHPIFINETGATIIKEAKCCHFADDLITHTCQVYNIDPVSTEGKQVVGFIENLIGKGIIIEEESYNG